MNSIIVYVIIQGVLIDDETPNPLAVQRTRGSGESVFTDKVVRVVGGRSYDQVPITTHYIEQTRGQATAS